MNRFLSSMPALLLVVALIAGPGAAENLNLTATARYSASSEWESDRTATNSATVAPGLGEILVSDAPMKAAAP